MSKPLILVTNDDGMNAPGIRSLVETARQFGEVFVVAPNSAQSGQGHAITIEDPLRLHRVEVFEGIESYECSGTPVDCVKLATNILLKDRKIDLCVSGINHGSNASINVLYSGTMSAAMEASMEGINSIGFSLCDYSFDADFSAAKVYAHQIIAETLEHGIPKGKLLNVNIPNLPLQQIKGTRICRQGEGRWDEKFQEGLDPRGQKYYWLTGSFVGESNSLLSDHFALENGYVAIVPIQHDLTNFDAMHTLHHLQFDRPNPSVH